MSFRGIFVHLLRKHSGLCDEANGQICLEKALKMAGIKDCFDKIKTASKHSASGKPGPVAKRIKNQNLPFRIAICAVLQRETARFTA